MKSIFDSHAHYDDPRFDPDRQKLIASLPGQGIVGVLNAGTDLNSSKTGILLSEQYPFFYCAVGIHPQSALEASEEEWEKISALTEHPKVCAIGEIGLDYYYEPVDKERQLFWLERQLQFAVQKDLPVIIHDREAHGDTLRLLQQYRPKGVVHCFSGSAEMAREIVKLGMYIGFTGVITFKNARKALEAAEEVPVDRLLIETDCPYLAPEPLRGKRCDSSMLCHTAAKLAEIKGIETQELFDYTCENACRLYGITL